MRKLVLFSMFLTVSLGSKAQVNDLCGNSQTLIVDAPCEWGSTTGAGVEDPNIDPALYPADVWYSFQATTDFSVVYVYPDSSVDPDLYMFDMCEGYVFAVGTAGLFAGEVDSVFISTTPGNSYYISVVGWQDAPYGDFCIEVQSRTDDGTYDPCLDFVNIDVNDPCLSDNVNNDTLVKTYTFTATSSHSYITLEIEGLFYLPAMPVVETDCYGTVIHYDDDPYYLEGNLFVVDFPSQIGQQYLFGVYHTDPSFSYQFPMEYCVDVKDLAEVEELEGNLGQVFPNPFRNELTVDLKGKTGSINLYDLSGRLVLSEIVNEKLIIDTQLFEEGVYLMRANIDGRIYQRKIIKE